MKPERSEPACSSVLFERRVLRLSERSMAIALVLEFAETNCITFSMMNFYDDDADFLDGLAARLEVTNSVAFRRKITRVVRKLVNFGVLHSRMRGTAKEYFGEPAKQMSYWLRPGKEHLLREESRPGITMGPQGEAEYLLRHAYPRPETPNV